MINIIDENIEKYRREIDEIDKQIIYYLNKRKEISNNLINDKISLGLDVYSPDREEEIVNRLFEDKNNKLTKEIIRKIYREIFASSKSDFI